MTLIDLDKRLDHLGRVQTLSRPRRPARKRTRALSFGAVDYTVPGIVPVEAQQSSMVCWATVTAMLMGWRDSVSYVVDQAMDMVGKEWGNMVRANRGLLGADKARFLAAAGLQPEPPMSHTVEGWESMLRRFGPLWVTTDENPGAGFSIHARILTAIQGDGTPGGTTLTLINPAGGRVERETLAVFLPKYEAEAATPGRPLRIQVVHWPESTAQQARLTQSQSFRAAPVQHRDGPNSLGTATSAAMQLAAVGLDLSEFEMASPRALQAPAAIDWCRIRHSLIRSAVEVQGDWLAAGGLMRENNNAVRDMLVMFWRDGVGMTEQQARATAAISAADHPQQAVWSAAFISWCVRNALGNPPPPHNAGFTFHQRHMAYIADALRNRENNDQARPFWLFDINDPNIVPEDGDILCLNRGGTNHTYPGLRQQWFVNQPNAVATGISHCDIVIGHFEDGGRRWIETIGGNVDDTVGPRYYTLDANGRLVDRVQLNGNPIADQGNVTQTVGNRSPIIFGLIRLTACPNFPN